MGLKSDFEVNSHHYLLGAEHQCLDHCLLMKMSESSEKHPDWGRNDCRPVT